MHIQSARFEVASLTLVGANTMLLNHCRVPYCSIQLRHTVDVDKNDLSKLETWSPLLGRGRLALELWSN